MPVHRRSQRACRHWVFHEREAITGLLAIDHEPHPNASEETRLAIMWSKDFWR
jgi:hypothetical protein